MVLLLGVMADDELVKTKDVDGTAVLVLLVKVNAVEIRVMVVGVLVQFELSVGEEDVSSVGVLVVLKCVLLPPVEVGVLVFVNIVLELEPVGGT